MKISFIGGGNMGEAMLAALLEKGLSRPDEIRVGEVREDLRKQLERKYGVTVEEDNHRAVGDGDIIILAVKPQSLAEAMTGLNGALRPSQLVLSVIAGATVKTISEGLNHGCIVRAMPNTPARIGQGMTAWTASAGVTAEQKGWAKDVLAAMGKELYFDDEKYLDMATAVSGSGPAYFFLLAESLIDAAVDIGLSPEAAGELVIQTMLGSARLLEASDDTPAELRRKVTSPGGTTAAAIEVFEGGGLPALVRDAVRAACKRARELGE